MYSIELILLYEELVTRIIAHTYSPLLQALETGINDEGPEVVKRAKNANRKSKVKAPELYLECRRTV